MGSLIRQRNIVLVLGISAMPVLLGAGGNVWAVMRCVTPQALATGDVSGKLVLGALAVMLFSTCFVMTGLHAIRMTLDWGYGKRVADFIYHGGILLNMSVFTLISESERAAIQNKAAGGLACLLAGIFLCCAGGAMWQNRRSKWAKRPVDGQTGG